MKTVIIQPTTNNKLMSNIQKWKIIKSQMVFENKWCQVRQDEVELPNGQVIDDFFVNVRQDTEDIEVILVPIAEVLEKTSSGEICVSGTIACLFLGLNFLGVIGH